MIGLLSLLASKLAGRWFHRLSEHPLPFGAFVTVALIGFNGLWFATSSLLLSVTLAMTALTSFFLGAFLVIRRREYKDRSHQARYSLASQLHQQIDQGKKISLYDPSTLLFQPWYFELRVAEEITRCERYGTRMAVMRVVLENTPDLLKGDWFRGFADELGAKFHQAVRATDLVARLSESEYVACLPHTTEKGARAAAERVTASNPALRVSIGWAIFPEDGRGLRSLLEQASAHSSEMPFEATIQSLNNYADILTMIREDKCGEIVPNPGQTPRALKARLRKASKQLGVALRVWDADGSIHFETSTPESESTAA